MKLWIWCAVCLAEVCLPGHAAVELASAGMARCVIVTQPGATPAERYAAEELAADDDVLDDLTRQETIETVRNAVLSLPMLYREAVVLCDLEYASYEAAAAALGCPVGTVRSRLSRGRAMLGQKLAVKAVRSMS